MTKLDQNPKGSLDPNREVTDPRDSPNVDDPGARSYAEKARLRASKKQGADLLKQKSIEFGHGPPVTTEKAQQIHGLLGGGLPKPDFGMEPPPAPPPAAKPSTPPPVGVGSAYEVNRAMADGRTNGPMNMRQAKEMQAQHEEGKRTLSPETQQALSMAHENAIKAQAAPPSEQQVQEEVAQAMHGAATKDGDLDKAESEIITKSDKDKPATLDFDALSGLRSRLMSKKRRTAIEAKLKPLDLTDMIMKREMTQRVPVVPGKFELILRTQSQRENMWCLQYIFDTRGSDAYTQELLSSCHLACCLVAINDSYLPDHLDNKGTSSEVVNKDNFQKKLDALVLFPIQLIADMSVQLFWFEDRVNDLLGMDSLKNG